MVSYAGLTRVSIAFARVSRRTMDCRVKPGNDAERYVHTIAPSGTTLPQTILIDIVRQALDLAQDDVALDYSPYGNSGIGPPAQRRTRQQKGPHAGCGPLQIIGGSVSA